MASNAIQAGKAFIEFVLQDKKLDGQLARIGQKLRKVGSWGAVATGPLIAGFTAAALTFASVAGTLDDLSDRTDVPVAKLSELQFAAEQNDATLGDLEKAFRSLQAKGIDPANFDEVAASIASIEDPTKRADAAMTLFGKKTGTALLPMIMALPEAEQQARDLAVTLSAEDVVAADRFGKALDASKAQLVAIAVQIGAAIAGPLTEFLVWSQQIVATSIRWIKENQTTVAVVAGVTLAVAGLSAGLVVLGTLLAIYSAAVAGATVLTTQFGIVLAIISAHPIIAALTLITGLALGVAAAFGLASYASSEFQGSLDGVKMPGAAPNAGLTARSQAVQTQLSSALAGRAVSPVSTAPGAAPPPRPARDYAAEIAANTKATADAVKAVADNTRPLKARELPQAWLNLFLP